MNLWIRSQDKSKNILSKGQKIIDSLLIKESIKAKKLIYEYDIYSTNGFRKSYLATYKSKERAIEVLNEIQKILKPQYYDIMPYIHKQYPPIITNQEKITGCIDNAIFIESSDYKIKQFQTDVYEMPKE